MRIAVASDDQTTIALHTGRCRGFVIFEVAAGQARRLEYRENRHTPHALGECDPQGAGRHAGMHSHAPLLQALGDCCALITGGMGPRLVSDLAAQGIEAYVCEVASVDEAARQFAAGRLVRAAGRSCPHGKGC